MAKPTDIELSVDLSADDVKQSAETLGKSIKEIFDKSANTALDSKLKGIQQKMSKVAGEANRVAKEMERLEQVKIPTEEYKQVQAEFDKALKASQDYQAKVTDKILDLKAKMKEVGEQKIPTNEYKEIAEQIQKDEAELDKLNTKLDEAQTKFNAQPVVREFSKIDEEYSKITSKISNLNIDFNESMEEITKTLHKKLSPDQFMEVQPIILKYKELYDQVDKLQAASPINKLAEQTNNLEDSIKAAKDSLQQLVDTGKDFKLGTDTDEYKNLESQLNDIYNKGSEFEETLQKADSNMRSLVAAGRDFTLGSDTEQYSKLSNQLADLNNQQRISVERWNELTGAENGTEKTSTSLLDKIRNLAVVMQGLSKHSGRGRAAIEKLSKSIKNYASRAKDASNNSNNLNINFKKGITTILKYGLGIRSLYMLFNKLRQAILEGIQHLVLWEGETGRANKSISALVSSLATLKNQIGAAVAPLVNALAPALAKIVDLLTIATQRVGMFMAAFSGQKTYLVADKVQKNYAESLADTAANAKKAEKALKGYLSPLDEVNKYQSNDDDSNLGGAGDTGSFSEVPIDPKFLAWLDDIKSKLQEIIEQILGPFRAAWANMGEIVIEAWKNALSSMKTLIEDIGQSFLEVWTNGTGQEFLENILQLVADIGNWVASIATAFDEAWTEGERGTALIQSWFDKFNAIMELIHTIGESMRTVWDEGFGKEFIADILEIMTNINNFFANLADRFKEAWEQNDVGTNIIRDLSQIVLDFTNMLNDMTAALSEWAAGLDFNPLLTSFENLLSSIEPVVDLIIDGLAWAWENVLLPLGSWVIEEAVPTALDVFSSALDVLAAVLEKLAPYVQAFFDDFLKPLGEFIWDNIQEGLQAFSDVLSDIADVLKGNTSFKEFIDNLSPLEVGILAVATAIGAVTAAMALFSAGAAIASTAGAILGGVIGLITSPVFLVIAAIAALIAIGVLLYQNWDTIKEKAAELWENIKEGFEHFKEKIKDGVDNIKEHFVTFGENLKKIWEGIKQSISDTWENIKKSVSEKFDSLKEKIRTNIENIKQHFTTFKENLVKIWTTIKDSIKQTWENITKNISDKIQNIKSNIKSNLDGIKQHFETFKTNVVNIVKGIWDGMKGHLNNIIGGFEGLVNKIISGVNSMIGKLNTFSFELPDWVPGIGGNRFGFNIRELGQISIPRLAQGAVIPPNNEFMAMLGDQKSGTNIETPLDTMVQAFKQAINEMGGTGGVSTINFILPNKKLVAQYAIEGGRVLQTSTGRNPFDLL